MRERVPFFMALAFSAFRCACAGFIVFSFGILDGFAEWVWRCNNVVWLSSSARTHRVSKAGYFSSDLAITSEAEILLLKPNTFYNYSLTPYLVRYAMLCYAKIPPPPQKKYVSKQGYLSFQRKFTKHRHQKHYQKSMEEPYRSPKASHNLEFQVQ